MYIAALCMLLCAAASGTERPNILFLLADDLAKAAISSYGSHLAPQLATPNIDALAAQGARFEHSYVTNSLCAPSRAVLLTGLHTHENGVHSISQKGFVFDRGVTSVGSLLHGVGYATAQFGKCVRLLPYPSLRLFRSEAD